MLGILRGFIRGHVILLSVVGALLLIYTLVGFLLVPRIARSQIEDYVTNTLHRQVRLGELRFNPFAFDASVGGFELREPDGAALVSFRHLYVNAELASLWQRAIVLKEVQLAAPDIQLVVARDGSVNLAKLVPASPEPAAADESPPPRVRIGRLAVFGGRVGLQDHTRSPTFVAAVKPIRFALTDFRTDSDYRNAYRFAGTTSAGEDLEWSGGFTVQPLGSTGQFRVQNLKLATVDSYLQDSLPFRVAGQALFRGSYEFKLDPFVVQVMMPLVAVRNLSVSERTAGANAPVTVPELDLEQLVVSLDKRLVTLKRVDARNAHVDIAREQDGTISLARLLGPESTTERGPDAQQAPQQSPQQSTGSQPPATNPWTIRIDTLRLQDAALVAEDRKVSPTARFELAPANVTVTGWQTNANAPLKIDADVRINQKSTLFARGDVQLEPLQAALAIDITDFDLPSLQPYIAQETAMTLHTGELSAKTQVTVAAPADQTPSIGLAGEVSVANLRTTDNLLQEDFIKWRNLSIDGIDYKQNPDRLTIERIVARQPYARVIIARDKTLNVAQVLSPGGKSTEEPPPARDKTAKPAAPAPAMAARIRSVQVIDGSANFADYSIEPSFATGIQSLNGKVSGLSSAPSSRAQVSLQGKVDKYAPVDITGDVNLLSAAKYTELAMNFRNMELTTFNPYSGKFAGYNISRGKLSTELRYHVENRKLAAQHHIVLDNLEFGAKTDSKDAAPIPIKLGVALLKDRNGIIDINLPISGTLDDPSFELGPIIWKAILGLLTKIVTAPFAALGALFGGGDELAYVDFPAGSAQLNAGDSEKLSKLSRALVERPQLRLNVPMTVTGAEDSDALAHSALVARVPDLSEPLPDDGAKKRRLKQLEGVYKTVAGSSPEYPAETKADKSVELDAQLAYLQENLLSQLKPDAAALDALAQQRARAVQDSLLTNPDLNPERVFMTSERSGKTAEGAQVRMEMKLE